MRVDTGTGERADTAESRVGFQDPARLHHPLAPRGAGARRVTPELEELRGLYERYCDHEARGLLALIPRDGLRALHLLARAAQPGRADDTLASGDGDPMGRLVAYARHLLPLPPYERWLEAYLRDRKPFLEALGIPTVPERAEPVLVGVRPVGDGWTVELHLKRGEGDWRGFLSFARSGEPAGAEPRGPYRTTDIFRGPDPEELLTRFRDFHSATLSAFLRSVCP